MWGTTRSWWHTPLRCNLVYWLLVTGYWLLAIKGINRDREQLLSGRKRVCILFPLWIERIVHGYHVPGKRKTALALLQRAERRSARRDGRGVRVRFLGTGVHCRVPVSYTHLTLPTKRIV